MKGRIQITREDWLNERFTRIWHLLTTQRQIRHRHFSREGELLEIDCEGPFIPKGLFFMNIILLAELPFGETFIVEFCPARNEPYHVILAA